MLHTSLFAHLVAQQRDVAGSFADHLFTTGELDPGVAEHRSRQLKTEGPGSPQTAFGYAFADALAQRAVQALIDGRPIEEVGERLGQGLNPRTWMDLPQLAYGLDAFMTEVQKRAMFDESAEALRALCVGDMRGNGGERFQTLVLQQQSSLKDLCVGIDRHLVSQEAHDVLLSTVVDFDKMLSAVPPEFKVFDTVVQRMMGSPGSSPSLLALLEAEQFPHADRVVRTLFEQGTTGPQPVVLDNDLNVASPTTALGYALANAIAVHGAEALAAGRDVVEVGRLVGRGLVTLTAEHLAYGVDSLKAHIVALQAERPGTALDGMIYGQKDAREASPAVRRGLVLGIDSALTSDLGRGLLVCAMSDLDKTGQTAVFGQASKSFQAERAALTQVLVERDLLFKALNEPLTAPVSNRLTR